MRMIIDSYRHDIEYIVLKDTRIEQHGATFQTLDATLNV